LTHIPASQLTHVIYAFAQLNADGICASINSNDDGGNMVVLDVDGPRGEVADEELSFLLAQ
jgi:GH18 family chitinase